MLHKSFKPAKCKTSLKLAVSRIKLLKNKRDSQVKHLKRELAQLLDSGQEQTARIRVEHVVREEKTMAAYDLIEIYCELIVARLPIIESQKNCPIDLKEAISSVIFASPRCADIPELMDVRKHFTAKYGKEFVSVALELRPDCGVSRLLVGKLSTRAPDGPTKIKILSAIAEEHNVNWDPKSFGEEEMKPPEDLLNGPNTFEQSSKMHVEPHNVQELNSVDKGHPNSRAPSKQYEKHDAPVNSHGCNSRLPSHFQNIPSTEKAMPSDTAHPDLRPLGTGSEEMEFRHSYPAEGTGYSGGSQSWNMEFKDATAAAQAAAESAERASMAARAAAELSSQGRISRQHSTESKKASIFKSRDEGLHNYASSRFQGEKLAKDPVNNTSRRSNSGTNPEISFESEQDDLAGLAERFYNLKSSNKSSQLAPSKSSNSSVDDYPQVSDYQMADRHSRKISSELGKSDLLGEENIERESSESEKEFASEVHDGMKSDHVGYFQEASIRKQSSSVSSHSHFHSQIPRDDHNAVSNFSHEKFSEDAVKEPSTFYEGKFHSTTKETNSFENAAAVFDDSASDDDDEFKFDEKGKHNDLSRLYYSSEGRKSSSHLFANTSPKSPRINMEETLGKSSSQSPFASDWHSSSVFSEHLVSDTVPSQAEYLLSVAYDDSDGPSSESEEKLDEPKLVGSTRTGTFPHKDMAYSDNSESTKNESPHSIGSVLAIKENVESNRKTLIQPSALDSDVEEHSGRNQAIEVADTDTNFSYGYLHNKQTSHKSTKSESISSDRDDLQAPGSSPVSDNVQRYQSSDILEDTKSIKESSLETGNELNFGILTGGLRNKGYRRPAYRSNPSDNSSVSKQAEENSTRIEQSSSSFKVDFSSGAHDQEQYNQMLHPKVTKKPRFGTPAPYSDASSDESDEELPKQTVSSSQEPNTRKSGTEVNKRSGLKSYFDSDNSEPEEDLPKQTVTSKVLSGPGFSRRTKGSLSNSERNSYSKSRVPSGSSVTVDYAVEQKLSSVSSCATETQVKPPSQTRSSFYQGSSEQGSSEEQAPSRPNLQSKRSIHGEPSSRCSYSNNNRQNHPSQSKISDYWGSSEQHRSTEPSKPIPESKRSSREESLKSSAKEQPSNPPSRTVSSSGAKSTKTSSSHGAPSRENSINKASHVHPKLPDYDTFTAHLLSIRQNRQ